MEPPGHERHSASRRSSRPHTPRAFRICDGLTEAVLYFMIVFSPWALGTTDRWAIWTMNVAGYALGVLLLSKWLICRRTGHRPALWGADRERNERKTEGREEERTAGSGTATKRAASRFFTTALAAFTVVILGWCLVSAINARSTFFYRQMAFVPRDYIAWLPHSYDSWATWQAFWMYLGLALTFWAARDWLLGRTAQERREARETGATGGGFALPMRLRRLLWVLCLNGALLALEGILQRLSGTGKLLWLLQPRINRTAEVQFGPYAYRSNAAQYLNLLWPVCLGFWWALRRDRRNSAHAGARVGGGPHMLLLPCAVLMAAAPIISTSRGGAIVAAGGMFAAFVPLMLAQRKGHWLARLGITFLFTAALGIAGYLGWEKLAPRLKTIFSDEMSGRVELYRNAAQMARDFPVLGTGPGTFPWLYQLYRAGPAQVWEAYAHNDWLETRITFGGVGFAIILAALMTVLARWFGGGGITAHWLLVSFIWLALAGCLVHARFDFPFQIHSVLLLFLLLCAVLSCLSRKP